MVTFPRSNNLNANQLISVLLTNMLRPNVSTAWGSNWGSGVMQSPSYQAEIHLPLASLSHILVLQNPAHLSHFTFYLFFFPLICLPQRANLWLMYLSFLRTSNNIWSSLDAKIIFFYIKKEWVERERERRRQKGWEKGKNKIGKENERHKSLILRQPSHSLVNSLSFIKAFR